MFSLHYDNSKNPISFFLDIVSIECRITKETPKSNQTNTNNRDQMGIRVEKHIVHAFFFACFIFCTYT